MSRIERTYPLYSCTAEIRECYTGKWGKLLVLHSYNTDVAMYQVISGELTIFNNHSATTSQHIHKFNKWLKEHHFNYVENLSVSYRVLKDFTLFYNVNGDLKKRDIYFEYEQRQGFNLLYAIDMEEYGEYDEIRG